MSYTSKYTGQEIDSLLDKIEDSTLNNYFFQKTLWEGQIFDSNTSITLNESIENYDLVIVEAAVISDSGAKSTIESVLINVKDVNYSGSVSSGDYSYNIYTSTGGDIYYRVLFNFTDSITVTLLSATIGGNSWTNPHLSKITGIKLGGGNFSNKSDTPIGAIIPIMGTEVPQDYLVCDGSELEISKYSELANYFEKQFGTKNHFGGDGTTTFAIPDLRNEFLRGYHNGKDEQLSGEIGVHQDATKQYALQVSYSAKRLQFGNPVDWSVNYGYDTNDTRIDGVNGYQSIDGVSGAQKPVANGDVGGFTARPTNVAVLYCIKYTESGSGVSYLGRACFGFKHSNADGSSLVTNDFLPVIKKFSNSIETDSQGNPILKAGKTYRVAVNIYRLNLTDGADNRFYLSRTINANGDLELICAVHPVTRSKEWTAQNTTDYFDYIAPSEDFSLKFIAKHAENGQESSGDFISLMYFNVEIEEIA